MIQKSGRKQTRFDLLLIAFVALQIADVITTNHALLAPENYEANPVMAGAMAHLGAAWWLPKLAVVALIFLSAPLVSHRPVRSLVAAYYASIAITLYAVLGNLTHL